MPGAAPTWRTCGGPAKCGGSASGGAGDGLWQEARPSTVLLPGGPPALAGQRVRVFSGKSGQPRTKATEVSRGARLLWAHW